MQMKKNKHLSQEQVDSLSTLPLALKFTPQGHDQGLAPYFRIPVQYDKSLHSL